MVQIVMMRIRLFMKRFQYYVDADGDGYGSVATAMLCESSAPAGFIQ